MNVRLHYNADFLAAVYYNQQFFINSYTANIELLTQTDNREAINVAMERLRFFIQVELANTLFVQDNQVDEIMMMDELGFNLTTLPEVPLDQIVGLMLYSKLNAIMEQRMVVTSLDISSLAGDRVWYLHEAGEPIGPFAADGWWHDPSPTHSSVVSALENIVKVNVTSWTEHGLTWTDEYNEANDDSVVYVNFNQNEDQ